MVAFDELGKNYLLVLQSVGIIFSIAFFNAFGVATTKNASAAQRSTIDTSRTVLIWIFFLIYPYDGHEEFHFLQLGGFILLVFGTLVYNEIIILPFLGFNRYTKEALQKEEAQNGGLLDRKDSTLPGSDYIGLSPHAAYDATRAKRSITKKI